MVTSFSNSLNTGELVFSRSGVKLFSILNPSWILGSGIGAALVVVVVVLAVVVVVV